MSNRDQLIANFLGGDPIAGMLALQDLLELDDTGEEALFSKPIEFPKTAQVRRRWLQYVASRGISIMDRLLDRMQSHDRFNDAYATAYLFAGLSENRPAINALYEQLKEGVGESRDYMLVAHRFMAWGYAGGDASYLWDYVRDDSYLWEKIITFAFRGSCIAFSRMNIRDDWAIEQLITHELHDNGLRKISNAPDSAISNLAVGSQELWMQANDTFMTWRRGEVADEILRNWSRHDHWRVRSFGAQILASFGFQRTVTPVIEWLRREPVETVRNSLLHALERSETEAGADVLVEYFSSSSQEGRLYLAKAGWRASDKSYTLEILKTIAHGEDVAGAEAVVSLARLGHRYSKLTEMLDSYNAYRRLNAALAIAYLNDKTALERLVSMQREAATPFERIILAAALAILGKPNGATDLHSEIVTAAGLQDFDKRVDLFFMHRYLQTAVLDALRSYGQQRFLNVWRNEFEPFDPIFNPVVLRSETAFKGPNTKSNARQEVEPDRVIGTVTKPLNVFISYSHQDEKMREKLYQHLSPLMDSGLIRIWHDRKIEAGGNWEGEINKEIGTADIILLLVSASFLNSRYCRKELIRALDQRDAGKSLPIPIILRPCDWSSVFNLDTYKTQALPRDNRPVAGGGWPNQDAAFATITKELRAKIERMLRVQE